ncbi:hypothetical protein PF002_g16867 [Phytophthora fragariae]|uniref:Phorbol-ester/DAG-type domain-containing protein n=1 Tax=Phytophthora fragariae TaxID=53985 RepID=A0A6A3YEE3_9STRA|nr:hypothetical protein PF002_g16867 [Phytophthora fragariae]
MELRFRGKKSAEDADAVAFWLCEGLKKRRVLGKKTQTLTAAAPAWELARVLEDADLHFMNESTGLVVPRDEEMGAFISDRDVVRLCTTKELDALLQKFATRDQEVVAEMMNPKAATPIGAALSRLKKISVTNPTLKKLQKTFDEHTSPHSATAASEADALDQFPEVDPIFESGEVEEMTEDVANRPKTCDMCEVSWPDDASGSMFRWTKLGIITHQGCAQFTADVLAEHPEITTRDEFLSMSKTPVSSLNKPGTFHVTVHRAMELPGTQLIGKQAPYAKLSLLPWKEPMQTKPVENGGRNPVWIDAHDNEMQFSHMYNSTITPIPLLEVEVYNSNYLADDQVACTLVDMSPLLRYPNIKAKRWFTLSSRALLTQSTGQPRIMLGIKFVPTEGEISMTNAHKFRVHQLKSIGLAIPVCAVCDRSIMNALNLKSIWGYRCELCGIDVHKGCMMKATIQCECVAQELLSAGQEEKEHGEYALSYIFGGILVYMLYRLHIRLEGAFVARWIGYEEYEREQEEQQKLYRPLADLHVAVHEARLSNETDSLLIESQSRLKDVSSSKLGFYVRIKYRPNDKESEAGDLVLNPSGYDETTVAWTSVVGKSKKPNWRKTSLSSAGAMPSAKLRKALPFRNLSVSWRHDPRTCTCDQCAAYQRGLKGEDEAKPTLCCGVDHHAYYFPIPQASRKNFSGRDDLVPWSSFPGLLQFDLCISLTGEAKETPDLIAATATIPLRSLLKRDDNSGEMFLPLSSFSTASAANDSAYPLSKSEDTKDGDYLVVRVELRVPERSNMSSNDKLLQSETYETQELRSAHMATTRKKGPVSHVERNFSEFVCESMVEKEKSKIIGANLLDAFWKVKDTIRQLQNEIGRACGALACAENLLNWTHPWKTATAFVAIGMMTLVFSVVRGRWAILVFGVTEFGAAFVDDAPASKRPERAVYMTKRKTQQEQDEEVGVRLRYHALWIGMISSKAEGERNPKNFFVVYRPYRFLLWKSEDDAEEGSPPQLQLLFDKPQAITDKSDEKVFAFHVAGVNGSGSEETRVFTLNSLEAKNALLDIVRQSCRK